MNFNFISPFLHEKSFFNRTVLKDSQLKFKIELSIWNVFIAFMFKSINFIDKSPFGSFSYSQKQPEIAFLINHFDSNTPL